MRRTTTRWCVKGLKRDYARLFDGLTNEALDFEVENFDGVDDGGSVMNEIATFEFSNEVSEDVDVESLIGERVKMLAGLALSLGSTPVDGIDVNPDDPAEWLSQINFVPCVGSVEIGKLAWVFACYDGQYALARSTRGLVGELNPDLHEDAAAAKRFLAVRRDVEMLFSRFDGVQILAGLLDGPTGFDVTEAEENQEIFDIRLPNQSNETGRLKASALACIPEQAFEFDPAVSEAVSSERLFERALVDLLSDRRRGVGDPYGSS